MEDEYILDYSRIVFTKNNQPTNKATKKKHNKKPLFSEYFYKYDLDYQNCWHRENCYMDDILLGGKQFNLKRTENCLR